MQFELESLKCHQHCTELFPGYFSSIDHQHGKAAPVQVCFIRQVRFYSASNFHVFDPQSVLTLFDVLGGQSAANFLDQTPQLDEPILTGCANPLELVPCWLALAQFKCFKRHHIAQQACLKMKLMNGTVTVGDGNRIDWVIVKVFYAKPHGDIRVEALGAEQRSSLIGG